MFSMNIKTCFTEDSMDLIEMNPDDLIESFQL